MTSNAQTEARAIAFAAAGQVHDNGDARCVETIVEKLVTTALAAKNEEIRRYEISVRGAVLENAGLRAQLAEANKALEQIENLSVGSLDHPHDVLDEARDIARRAREQGDRS